MTERHSSPSGGQGSKTQAAREETSRISQRAAHAGGEMTNRAAGQGREIAAETGRQAQNLFGEATTQLKEQAGARQKRAAESLRALGNELQSMSGKPELPTMATDLVRQASGTVCQAADWLEQHEPGEVVNEVRDFARRHPGMFLAGAATVGLLAGRVSRNAAGDGDGRGPQPAPQPDVVERPPAEPEPSGAPQGPVGARTPEAGPEPQAHTEER
jgi:hypothetical protein